MSVTPQARPPERWRWWAWPVFYRRAARAIRAAAIPAPPGALAALFVTDLHGNIGMCRVVGAAVRAAGAALVLNGGDTAVHGTRPEGAFVRALARAVPPGVPIVVASGNHDSVLTDTQQRRSGMVVLDGSVAQVAGLRILGDADPRLTSLGRPVILQGPGGIDELAGRLARVATEEAASGRAIDLLLVHDPYAARPALATGAIPLALSGHLHARSGPERVGRAVRFTGSSSGRDIRQQTLIGPLRNDAELAVFYFDPAGRRWTHYRVLTVRASAAAAIGPLTALP